MSTLAKPEDAPNGPPPAKKARTTTACLPCAKARRKCDSTLPVCKVCDAIGRKCEYRNQPGGDGDGTTRARKQPDASTSRQQQQSSAGPAQLPITADSIVGAVDLFCRLNGPEPTLALLNDLQTKVKAMPPQQVDQDILSSMRSTLQDDDDAAAAAAAVAQLQASIPVQSAPAAPSLGSQAPPRR